MDRIRNAPERLFHGQSRVIRQPGAQGIEFRGVHTAPLMVMPSMVPFRRSWLFLMSLTRTSINAPVGMWYVALNG